MLLHDNETRVDLLNAEPVAETIARLLRSHPGTPLTIGVHGDWGAGKSSVLEMLSHILESEPHRAHVLCLKFNGWRFQGFEDAKIALIEGVVEALVEARPALTRASEAVKNVYRRIDFLKLAKLAKLAGGVALTAATGIPTPDLVNTALGAARGLLADPAKLLTAENLKAAIDSASLTLKEPELRHVPEEIREFRKAFDDLLEQAKVEQLVVLVDDLDRCLPRTAIETLEAIRLFLFTSRTAFVIAADEAMIEYAVREHFPDLPESSGPRTYSRNYLEKLIQVPFRLPSLGVTETRVYVSLLLIGDAVGDQEAKFTALVGRAREKLKRPWEGMTIAQEDLAAAFGDVPPAVSDAFVLAEQLGPMLAEGTSGNPRQIKRFLNTLLLRLQTASARGFGELIKPGVLAKLMLAERFHTGLFDGIALRVSQSGTGVVRELAALEAHARAPAGEGSPREKNKESDGEEAPEIPQAWADSEFITEWARIEPRIGGENLSPYLFLTKDRRGFLEGLTALGHLAGLVEKLMGSEMHVSSLSGDLSKLQPRELEQLFDHLRASVMATGEFRKQPRGVDGMRAVVRANPALQSRLVDFLEQLPVARLGPWVVSGWDSTITDEVQGGRLAGLMGGWAKQSQSPGLAMAAKTATQIPKRQGRH